MGSFMDSPDTCLQPQPKGSPTPLSQLAVQVIQAGIHLQCGSLHIPLYSVANYRQVGHVPSLPKADL